MRALGFAAIVAGWACFDLSMAATSGQPALAIELLPYYVGAIAVGLALGALIARSALVFVPFYVVTASAAVAPKLLGLDLAWHLVCLPRALVLLLSAFALATLLTGRARARVWPSVGLGAIAAAAFSIYLSTPASLSIGAIAVGLALVATSAFRRVWLGRTIVGITVLAALSLLALSTYQNARLHRPDQIRGAAAATAGPRPNLLLVVLDTVSAHHLALYGYQRDTMPGLDAFVRANAIQYMQARSVSSWTLPAHGSLFTGLHPSEHGADHPRRTDGSDASGITAAGEKAVRWPADPLRTDVPTLAERLLEQGYRTAGVVSNCGYLSHVFGLDRGFEHYDDRCGARVPSLLLVELLGFRPEASTDTRRGESITDLGLSWIDADTQQPFFLFLNYMDAHAPYQPPRAYHSVFDGEMDGLTARPDLNPLDYDRALRYLDAQVTRLLQSLEQRGRLRDTVVIITSDHGEAFGQHGFWLHDRFLYEELIRVPLYVKPAGAPAPGRSDRPVTSPDIYHLALEQLGFDAPPSESRPVLAEWYQSDNITAAAVAKRDAPVPVDRDLLVWLDGTVKWIVSSKGDVEAYDLATDPQESRPLELTAVAAEQARARAREWWRTHPPLTARTSPALDPATVERLRNLGYVH